MAVSACRFVAPQCSTAYRQICRFRSCLLNQWNTGVSKPTEKCSPGDWKFRTTME